MTEKRFKQIPDSQLSVEIGVGWDTIVKLHYCEKHAPPEAKKHEDPIEFSCVVFGCWRQWTHSIYAAEI